jgi:MFS family permease
VLLGGVLTNGFDWHWVFLVNIPVGVLTSILIVRLLPELPPTDKQKLDVSGAILITAALMMQVYAIVGGAEAGWTSPQTLGLLGGSAALLILFLWTESRLKAPLVPLAMFRLRNLATANVMGVLWAAGMFAWFFLSALYMQLVLGYDPLEVGLAFLPSNLIMAALSIGISAKLVMRFGIKRPLAAGLACATVGLLLLARAPVHGAFIIDILPSMVLLGLGAGISFNPMLLAAMNDAKPHESGLASGLVNTSFMMGGALGLAILVSIAAAQTNAQVVSGAPQIEALNSGYHAAFFAGSLFTLVAVLLGIFVLRESSEPQQQEQISTHGSEFHMAASEV